MEITFEQLPQAVNQLYDKLENIERLLLQKTAQSPDSSALLTIQDAASFLTLSVATVYGLVSRTEIPHMKRGKRLYFTKEELTNWLKTGRKKTAVETAGEVDAYLSSKKKGGKL